MMPENGMGQPGLIAGIKSAIDGGEAIRVTVPLNGRQAHGEITAIDDLKASELMIGNENLVEYYARVYPSIRVPDDDPVLSVSIHGVRIHLSYPLCAVMIRGEAPLPTGDVEGFVVIL